MTPEQFRSALHDGLGRALRDVKSVPQSERREILLDACLHNRAIDPQLDSDRSAWLVEILDAAGEFDELAPRIVGEIPSHEDHWDVDQALHLAVRFARRSLAGAREALYAEFDRQRFNEEGLGGLQIVDLDGIAGLLHVAARIGRRAAEQKYYIDDYVANCAVERFGDEVVAAALSQAAQSDPHVARYVVGIDEDRARTREWREQRTGPPRPHGFWDGYDFDALRAHIDDPKRGVRGGMYWVRQWGRYEATDRDLERALNALIVESEPARQRVWLLVFCMRDLPRFEPRVLELLDSDDESVSWPAHEALSRVEHPEVRRVAIERLESGRCDAQTVSLLDSTCRNEDGSLVARALPSTGDREDLHQLARAINDLLEKRPTAGESNLLAWSYEHTGCANCRLDAVKKLLEFGCAPPAILDECRFDSSADIRALVQGT